MLMNYTFQCVHPACFYGTQTSSSSTVSKELPWLHSYSRVSIFLDEVKITVSSIHKFMASDPISTKC